MFGCIHHFQIRNGISDPSIMDIQGEDDLYIAYCSINLCIITWHINHKTELLDKTERLHKKGHFHSFYGYFHYRLYNIYFNYLYTKNSLYFYIFWNDIFSILLHTS